MGNRFCKCFCCFPKWFKKEVASGFFCEHYSEEMHNRILTTRDVKEAEHRILFNRNTPTTRWQRFAFCWSMCCRGCFIVCCPPCPPCIIQKIAFMPPRPTYDFVSFGPTENNDYRIRLSQDAKDVTNFRFFRVLSPRCFYVESGKRRIACVYFRSLCFGFYPRKVILYSHQNGEDLGLMITKLALMCQNTACDVLAYDYSGYGRSNGSCSEKHLYKDVERVYHYMIDTMKIPWEQIVAIGASLGSAATIHLASKFPVGGVVLQGSFPSAFRILWPRLDKTICMDRFVNVDKVGNITRPTLFIHGEIDDMFKVEHVTKLQDMCPGTHHLVVLKGWGHSNFEGCSDYWRELACFIAYIDIDTAERERLKIFANDTLEEPRDLRQFLDILHQSRLPPSMIQTSETDS